MSYLHNKLQRSVQRSARTVRLAVDATTPCSIIARFPVEIHKKELIEYVHLRYVARRYNNYNVYNSVSDPVTGMARQVANLQDFLTERSAFCMLIQDGCATGPTRTHRTGLFIVDFIVHLTTLFFTQNVFFVLRFMFSEQ